MGYFEKTSIIRKEMMSPKKSRSVRNRSLSKETDEVPEIGICGAYSNALHVSRSETASSTY